MAGGKNASRHRMRCSQGKNGCGARFTLRRKPHLYKRPIRCPHCGSTQVNDVEKARRAEQQRENTCHCHMYPFPHRAGTLRMCIEHPNLDEPTADEIAHYESILATPRSGFM